MKRTVLILLLLAAAGAAEARRVFFSPRTATARVTVDDAAVWLSATATTLSGTYDLIVSSGGTSYWILRDPTDNLSSIVDVAYGTTLTAASEGFRLNDVFWQMGLQCEGDPCYVQILQGGRR